jgi:C1A family cysteine protease
MRGFLIALLAATLLLALHEATGEKYAEFQQWKERFGGEFKSEAEEYYRRTIFYRNLDAIHQHNSNPANAYKMGVNQFTIYTQEEFTQRFLSNVQTPSKHIQMKDDKLTGVLVDWVEQGAVSAVKNQGICGGGALFATLGGV